MVKLVRKEKEIKQNEKYEIETFDMACCEARNTENTREQKTTKYRPLTKLLQKSGHTVTFKALIVNNVIPLNDSDIAMFAENYGLNKKQELHLHQKIWKTTLTQLHRLSVVYRQAEHTACIRNGRPSERYKPP